MVTYKEQIKVIRRHVKRHAKGVSVRRGRGTAYSYIEIHKPNWGSFTQTQRTGIKRSTGIAAGGNFAVIGPEQRKQVYAKAKAEEERLKRKKTRR